MSLCKLVFCLYVRNLPMRSWNCFFQAVLCARKSSQFTNEELKPDLLVEKRWSESRFAIYQWGVETNIHHLRWKTSYNCSQFTNEELKHLVWGIRSEFYLSCSQFTNEELKPYLSFFNIIEKSKFAIYQWGVETCILKTPYSWVFLFAIYQWGVETQAILSGFFNKIKCSQFTNEELKLVFNWMYC